MSELLNLNSYLNINYIYDNHLTTKPEESTHTPICVWVNDFDETANKTFFEEFTKANNNDQPVIPIYIDSYGGDVYALSFLLDVLKTAKKPVATICIGKAMSCGAILLTAGTEGYRFISPNSVVMIHDVSSVANGKFEEIVSDANETTRIQKLFYDTLDNNCKQDKGYFDKLVFNRGRADWYMNPEECKKHNVVDHIGLPMFTYEIKINQTFGLQEPNS